MHFLRSAPRATTLNLHCVVVAHGLQLPYRCSKPEVCALLLAYTCGDCSRHIVHFWALSHVHAFTQHEDVYEIRIGDDIFLGEEAGHLVVLTGMLSLYHLVGTAPP